MMEELKNILSTTHTLVKILVTGIVIAATLIGLVLLALILNKCITVNNTTKQKTTMYTTPRYSSTKLDVNTTVEGETLETKIERILNNKEPIKDGAPLIYTERKEGVKASTNIRTDRFEVAIEAMDKVAKSYKARREERAKGPETEKKDGGAEPIHGETPKKE